MNGEEERLLAAVLIPLLLTSETPPSGRYASFRSQKGDIKLPLSVKILLTARTHSVEHHKGQVSFPGGRFEEKDGSLERTALRETFEEVGIPPDAVKVIAVLPDAMTLTSNFTVRPYVGLVPHDVAIRVNPDEISELILLPLESLLGWKGNPSLKSYDFGSHHIWGATARMLQSLLEKLEIHG